MNDINLRTFPKNEIEAIAMVYIQNQDLSGKSPEEILEVYVDAVKRVTEHSKKIKPKQGSWL